MRLNKILWVALFFLFPILAHSQTATFTMTATNTATATATATATNTATATATNTATVTNTYTPTPAYIPGVSNANYQNKQFIVANGTYNTSGLITTTGNAVTIGGNFINTIWKYWSVILKGSGGSGAVTASGYIIPYPGGAPATSASIAVTGAGNTNTVAFISTPMPGWALAVSISGQAASTTITVQGVGQN